MTVPLIQDTPNQEYRVTPLELFFDLVFVFGVSQLSHHLLSHLSWRGAAETLVMLLAVFAVWFSTSWSATMFPVEESRMRRMMLTVMLLGLFMNASVTRAFTTSAWAFIIPFLLIQLGRAAWMIVNSTDAVFRDHYFRMLLWLIAATPLWIVGAAVAPEARLLWWVLAAGFDTIGRWLAHPIPGRRLQSENVPFDADHMLERCRLFLLIAFGRDGIHHRDGYCRSLPNPDDPDHRHVRIGGNSCSVGVELWVVASTYPPAPGRDEQSHTHQSLCGQRADGHGGRPHIRSGRQ
jgi:low temperature requirement protein LtrA